MLQTLEDWFKHPAVMWGVGIFSVLAVALCWVFIPRYLASLPEDFLTDGKHHERPAGAELLKRVGKNLLGVVLVVLGVLMLLLPGQGLITLLVGLMLIDFPGKHRLLQRLLGRKKVLSIVNKLRAKRDKPPLQAP
jgi:hypothetical protein